MKCWTCNHELIWGGDHTGEDYGNEDYDVEQLPGGSRAK